MRRKIFLLTLIAGGVVAAAVMAGCPASKKPTKLEWTLATMAKDIAIPIQAANVADPLPQNDQTIQEGQQVYMQACSLCHGEDGHARTKLGMAMYPPAMDLTSPHAQHWSDADLFWIIENGIRLTGMPGWKTMLAETDAWKLVQFLHALPRLNAEAAARQASEAAATENLITYGRTLVRQEGCYWCHQLNGEGGKVGPDLTVEGTRGRTDDWLVGHFKDPPAYSPGSIMPPFKNLTEQQLKALVTFLQSQKGGK